jgi:hypothetical protein
MQSEVSMNLLKKITYFLFFTISIVSLCDDTIKPTYVQRRKEFARKKKELIAQRRKDRNHRPLFRNRPPSKHRITHMLGEFAGDVFKINIGLFSWDSLKVFVITAPFFVGARMIDDKLHNCFFDHKKKKNRNEPAQWCKEVARLSIGIPIALLGTQAFFTREPNMQETSQVFLTGMPFVLLAKDFFKEKLVFDLCKRPFHEKFAKEQRAYGGFPSGHLAEATYTAVLYGMRFGPNYAVPLGAIAAFVTVIFLASNRHYLSQMIAGAGFGAMYALSANRLIDSKLAKRHDLTLGLAASDNGGPVMKLALKF